MAASSQSPLTTKLVLSAVDPIMRHRRGENQPELRRKLIKDRLVSIAPADCIVSVDAALKTTEFAQAATAFKAWLKSLSAQNTGPGDFPPYVGDGESMRTDDDDDDVNANLLSNTYHGLNYAVRCGAINEHKLFFFECVHAHFRADPSPDPSFISPETEEMDGIVPYFFCKSPGDLYYMRGESKPENIPIERLMGWHATDALTPIYPDLPQVLDDDVGVCVRAASLVASGTDAYALTTHPGHHANEEHYGGYCFLNNAYLIMRTLQGAHGKRPFLIDVDYHAGDGSASLICGDPDYLYYWDDRSSNRTFRSLHAPKDYPFVPGATAGFPHPLPWAVDVPPGATWEVYEPLLRKALEERPEDTDCIVVSLGYDTLAGDPDAREGHRFALNPADFAKMRQLFRQTGLPMCAVQEGGYNLEDIPEAAEAFFVGAPSSAAPWSESDILIAACDLDKTFYPPMGPQQGEQLAKNVRAMAAFEAAGGFVFPVTGNNPPQAQAKFVDATNGKALRYVHEHPGIFCNGGLVLGVGGAELARHALGDLYMHAEPQADFVSALLDFWDGPIDPGRRTDRGALLAGIGLLFFFPDHLAGYERAYEQVEAFCASQRVWPHCASRAELVEKRQSVLQIVLLFPPLEVGGGESAEEAYQARCKPWQLRVVAAMEAEGLSRCAGRSGGSSGGGSSGGGSSGGGSSGTSASGLKITPMKDPWPEVDICVGGVDKGSALAAFLTHPEVLSYLRVPRIEPSRHVAVFGDAANDVPMFRAIGGASPALRVGMPHATHEELVRLSNRRAEVSDVLEAICEARKAAA